MAKDKANTTGSPTGQTYLNGGQQTLHPRAADHPETIFEHLLPDESELTAGVRVRPGKAYGFFTDTSVCIGCKSCEVACKEWNMLPVDDLEISGMSYDNTRHLTSTTWRHVRFIEQIGAGGQRAMQLNPFQSHWLMMSDVCKHCENAGCLDACPTGSLFRTEFETVVVQQDVCNGCGYCVPSCPFGVIELSPLDGKAHKCTLCYDRLKGGLEPACAKACPTNSIQFGEVDELVERARQRVEELHALGIERAYLYGTAGGPGTTGQIGQLHAFFLLLDRPEIYNLPKEPVLPESHVIRGLFTGMATMSALGLAAAAVFWLGKRK